MRKVNRQLLGIIAIAISSFALLPATIIAAPMDEVFALLEDGGGTRSGKDNQQGYYITALGFSSRSSEARAYEEARLQALRHLNEMVNGVVMSGSTSSSIEYSSDNDNGVTSESSRQTFEEVVNLQFKGQLSAAKQIKKGQYDGQYFVAVALSQSDVENITSLRASAMDSSGDGSLYTGTTSIAQFSNSAKKVESKGLASMRAGEQEAREQALLDAMHNAVQQVQGVMLSGKSGMFNEALSFALSSKTEGYVSNYEILDEDIARGNYQVLILAHVNGGKLLKDVNFYLDIFDDPIFSIAAGNDDKAKWLSLELEGLGFTLHQGSSKPTHTFFLTERQQEVQNHNGKTGVETSLTVQLKDNQTGQVMFTIKNNPLKARIYVTPMERAKQVSAVSAYKTLSKQLGLEVVTALAKHSEKGRIHKIEIRNARRSDWQLFRHVLDNGTSGSVEGWAWSKDGKTMVLNYRYSGKLSSAMDEGLESLYQSYRKEGNGRRPTAVSISDGRAIFEMVRG